MQPRGPGGIERVVAAEDVGDLPEQQPRFGPVDRQAIEVEQRPAAREALGDLVDGEQDRRRGDARLDAAERVDELDLQRRGGRQFGLALGQRPQFQRRRAGRCEGCAEVATRS